MQAVKAQYKITYQSKDITRDITGMFISMTYTDKTIGEADELEITLKNDDLRWMGTWQPQKTDTITAEIITGSLTLPCGTFTVDEPTYSGSRDSGDIVTIKALGAGVKDAVRTKSSFAHEGKTLKEIANKIAAKYGYTVTGIIHNFSIARVTQLHESDLAFLHRIAEDFGYVFALRGSQLVFTYLSDLTARQASTTVKKADIMSYTIKDKVAGIYINAHLKHFHKGKKSLYQMLKNAGANPSVDTLQIRSRVDNDEQADYKVGGRLYKKNLEQVELDINCPGNIYLVSGNNVTISGWLNYDGTYFIGESNHTVDKDSNYTTSANYKRVKQ